MDEENKKVHISETQQPKDFALDDILAEFGAPPEPPEEELAETLGDRSKKLVLEQLPDGEGALGFSSLDDVISDAVAGKPEHGWDTAQPDMSDFAAAGFEVEKPKPPEPEEDPELVIAEALMEFGSAAQQPEQPEEAEAPEQPENADLAAAGFEQPVLEEPKPEPAEADLAAAGFEQPAPEAEEAAPESEPEPEPEPEETLRFDDPEAVIEEALREYGSASEFRDDDGST